MYTKHLGQCLVPRTHSVHDDDDDDEESQQKYSFLKTYHKVLLLNTYTLRGRILWLGIVF